ncbi:hypothetical protein VCHA53P481_150047 [Vibrio chagasii]|nr:hypothetical protein VCHA53P481_150047 [Vibrio chagasii]CAH7061015.1 hypothetical protein VCHA54P489_10227 [Vibrio chagasii]CAH7222093.1 hypothetical protein VCHA37P202_20131 [Vibrio chagasii]
MFNLQQSFLFTSRACIGKPWLELLLLRTIGLGRSYELVFTY